MLSDPSTGALSVHPLPGFNASAAFASGREHKPQAPAWKVAPPANLLVHALAKYELQLFKRGRFIFLLQFPPLGPPPTSVQLKPDLILLHMGNLLVCWAFLDGKLHCLSSWVEALE